jgi:murein DD-endopeptidase MepM/ murein hydrolase activator NlpD
MILRFPLDANTIRRDGPREALGNSYGKVRNDFAKWHKGWDLVAPLNTPAYAVASGKIVQRLPHVKGYGKCIILEFENPKYNNNLRMSIGLANYPKIYALYAHLDEMGPLGPISMGQVVGRTGDSGNAAGEPPHLHFEILLENALTHTTPRVDPGELFGYGLYQC